MVQRYLGNKAAPSIEFLRKAAQVLGVRFEWLAIREGPMNAEEVRRSEVHTGKAEQDTAEIVREYVPEFDYLGRSGQVIFIETLWQYLFSFSNVDEALGIKEKNGAGAEQVDWGSVDSAAVGLVADYLFQSLIFRDCLGTAASELRPEMYTKQLIDSAMAFRGLLPEWGTSMALEWALWYIGKYMVQGRRPTFFENTPEDAFAILTRVAEQKANERAADREARREYLKATGRPAAPELDAPGHPAGGHA